MTETTYVINLSRDGQNRYRHRHVLDKDRIVEFSAQYETYVAGKWHPIVRYDSAHGFAHRDLIHPEGTETKTEFRYWDYAQVLTYGERDLKENWPSYRDLYLKELARFEKRK